MRFSIAAPAEHERGSHYLVQVFVALHRSFRGPKPLVLSVARHAAHVGLYYRTEEALAPMITGQLLAAYPDLRIEQVEEVTDKSPENGIWFYGRLQLLPIAAPLVAMEEFVDRGERQLADPLAALLSAIASGRKTKLQPMVEFAVRPVSRWRRWRLRRSPGKRGAGSGECRKDCRSVVGRRHLSGCPRAAR